MTISSMKASELWLTVLLFTFGLQVHAQSYPARPVRIIVPYAAGGAVDVTARAAAQEAVKVLGQPMLVENKPGASAIIGMQACASSPPDGYTLCVTSSSPLSLNPHVFKNLPYDPESDFAPVINLARGYSLLATEQGAPFNTMKEMIAYAKANPGKLNWATWGAASIPEIYLRWTGREAGINVTAIPYKGVAPALAAVLAGESHITYDLIGSLMPHIRAGKLKALAVIGSSRSALLPGTPSLAEEGLDPGLQSYFGVFAPGKTPKSVTDQLNAAFLKAIESSGFREFARNQTLDVVGGSPVEFADFLRKDRANAGRVFAAIGVRPANAP